MDAKTKACNPANYGGTRGMGIVDWIVIHYTSNLGDTAKNNADYFAREAVKASAHYFVDEHEVWASVPIYRTAWHCGAQAYKHPLCRNTNSIGVEICMNAKDGSVRQGSIDRAAQLVRTLMGRYGIPPGHVLRHYDVTGKHCPGPMVDKPALWEDFKARLTEDENMLTYEQWKEYMARYLTEREGAAASAYAREPIDRMQAQGITDGQRPQAFATREEVLTMLDRGLEK